MLEDVVGRAQLETLHRLIFPQGAREEDERNRRTFLASHCQRGHSTVTRQALVGQDHVGPEPLDLAAKIRLVIYPASGELESPLAEFADSQLIVGHSVFQNEELKVVHHRF